MEKNYKALIAGIDDYPFGKLNFSVNDAEEIAELLKENYDKQKNFYTKKMLNMEVSKRNLLNNIKELFEDEHVDTALFYFSGHGYDDDLDGSIVTIDATDVDPGIRMMDIIQYVRKSSIKNKIVILDCCYSGKFGSIGLIGDSSMLPDGTVILSASAKNQLSYEVNGHGVFTNLLIEALRGGAADVLGRVTPGSIYAYIDQGLGSWEQRPLFKSNVSRFVNLRQCRPKVELSIIKNIVAYFPDPNFYYKLDPSFEPTNIKGGVHRNVPPYANSSNVVIFGELQKLNRNSLLEPVGVKDMYFAAMESKGCQLTPLGKHYWNLVHRELI